MHCMKDERMEWAQEYGDIDEAAAEAMDSLRDRATGAKSERILVWGLCFCQPPRYAPLYVSRIGRVLIGTLVVMLNVVMATR